MNPHAYLIEPPYLIYFPVNPPAQSKVSTNGSPQVLSGVTSPTEFSPRSGVSPTPSSSIASPITQFSSPHSPFPTSTITTPPAPPSKTNGVFSPIVTSTGSSTMSQANSGSGPNGVRIDEIRGIEGRVTSQGSVRSNASEAGHIGGPQQHQQQPEPFRPVPTGYQPPLNLQPGQRMPVSQPMGGQQRQPLPPPFPNPQQPARALQHQPSSGPQSLQSVNSQTEHSLPVVSGDSNRSSENSHQALSLGHPAQAGHRAVSPQDGASLASMVPPRSNGHSPSQLDSHPSQSAVRPLRTAHSATPINTRQVSQGNPSSSPSDLGPPQPIRARSAEPSSPTPISLPSAAFLDNQRMHSTYMNSSPGANGGTPPASHTPSPHSSFNGGVAPSLSSPSFHVTGDLVDPSSPPSSPKDLSAEFDPSAESLQGPAVVSAQMKCKVFLKQSHAQWKALGPARLKLYHHAPTNGKQLFVEKESTSLFSSGNEGGGGKILISTIVLTDGVERVGKTGVAVELSDRGRRTGIIYMVQCRNEASASGLIEGLLVGTSRMKT